MMRGLLVALSAAVVAALAVWAYRENHLTQQAVSELTELRREIAGLREAIDVQRAEWAYLNRPARLRELVELNFERLQLVPMSPQRFGRVDQIAYPEQDLRFTKQPVDVVGQREDDG